MIMKQRFHAFSARLRGLTLVEILVGLGVLSVLLAVAAPSMADLMERRRVIAAADEVASILTYAKAETNATNSLLFVRFDPDPNNTMSCAAVTTSSGFNSKCKCYYAASNICPGSSTKMLRLFQLPLDHVKFSAAATTWAGSANLLRFSRDQMGIATEGFRVNVVGQRKGYTLRVEVNTAGRVKICSPNSDMSGYVTCA